jgi:hypothetical protein
MAWLARNDMKTLLAAAAIAITGAVTVQAADIFTCGAVEYVLHDGRVERVCAAPVTTHWMNLGERSSALVYYRDEPDGLHVVVTTRQGVREKARPSGSRRYWPRASRPHFPFRAPRARRRSGSCSPTPAATWISPSPPPPFPPSDC